MLMCKCIGLSEDVTENLFIFVTQKRRDGFVNICGEWIYMEISKYKFNKNAMTII
jgi:hypothetical protein